MNIVYRGKLHKAEITIAVGDLFDAKVDAIVNSENSAFSLARNNNSISSQLYKRYGNAIQDELNAQTSGNTLTPGTVLKTQGRGDFNRIFHAGFHHPNNWPGMPGAWPDADNLEAIGTCISQVLDQSKEIGIKSVAFPLIGCGNFGLNKQLLIHQFFDVVENFDQRLGTDNELNIWLVVRDEIQFKPVIEVLINMLMELRSQTTCIPIEMTSVPLLDRLSERLSQRANKDWAKWQICRFTEIATALMCFGLCRSKKEGFRPEDLVDEGFAMTFGTILEHATDLAKNSSRKPPETMTWGCKFFTSVLSNKASRKALNELNCQRNNLAHGRKSLELEDIFELMKKSIRISEWKSIQETDGEFCFSEWNPWIVPATQNKDQRGLFERWQKDSFRYLIPESGEIFKIPRPC